MKAFQLFLIPVLTGLFLTGCGDGSKKAAADTNAAAPAGYLGAVMQAQKYSEKQIDLAYVNEAIQQFNAGEGHYPTNLQEMIPNYLGKMPEAPFGYKIDYDATSGTIKVVKQ